MGVLSSKEEEQWFVDTLADTLNSNGVNNADKLAKALTKVSPYNHNDTRVLDWFGDIAKALEEFSEREEI